MDRHFWKAGLCLLFLLVFAIGAQARDWHISQFRDTILVDEDGSFTVNEHITLSFAGQYNGIHRFIPTEYKGDYGSNYTLLIDVISVTDESGSALKYESSWKNGLRDLKIYIPGAEDTTKTVIVRYKVKNGIRYFPDHDELYWNITGNQWPVPIDAASAIVVLPKGVSGLKARGFTGGYGSRAEDLTINVSGNTVSAEINNPLSIREGMTLVAVADKGGLSEPNVLTRMFWFVRSNLILLLPLVTFLIMGGLWFTKGRDPDPGVSVAPMYEPPKDLSPAEAGTLVDDSVDPRDITSTLVDLAVRGYLKIEDKSEKILIFNRHDYLFHSLKNRGDWNKLASHERTLLEHMFAGGEDAVLLSSLKNRFYTAIPTIKSDILSQLKAKNLYSVDPDSAKAYAIVGVIATAVVFIVPEAMGWADLFQAPVMAVIAVILALTIAFFFAHYMPARTIKGARTRVAVLGFQEFMNRVDGERLRTMPSDTFEKYLPFAMALGVEERWARAFEGLIQQPPSWYTGAQPGMFHPLLFTNAMSTFTSTAHSTFVSAPRNSASSSGWGGGGGFGGGGFSGGGFGGGGGSAF